MFKTEKDWDVHHRRFHKAYRKAHPLTINYDESMFYFKWPRNNVFLGPHNKTKPEQFGIYGNKLKICKVAGTKPFKKKDKKSSSEPLPDPDEPDWSVIDAFNASLDVE